MKFHNFAAAFAGVALLAVVSFAQTARIEGDVIGFDGKPLAGAVIKMHRTDIVQDFKTTTDKKGHFIQMGLQPGGVFTVSVEVDGKLADSKAGWGVHMDNPAMSFDLQKSKIAQDAQNKALAQAIQAGGQITPDMERGLSDEQKEALHNKLKSDAEAMKKNKELNDAYSAGVTAMESKQWEQAIASLEKASTIDPKQTAIWVNLADSYLGDAAKKTGADRDAENQKGIDAYNKAIELKPDDAAIHNNYGLALANARKYPEAQAEMGKAAQLDPPGAGKYYYNLGAILVNIGQSDAAVEAFQKSIAADPNYADAYFQYGASLLAKAQADPVTGKITPVPGTVEAFQKCLSFGPKCSFSQQATDSIAALGSAVETQFVDPNKKAAPPKKTTKK